MWLPKADCFRAGVGGGSGGNRPSWGCTAMYRKPSSSRKRTQPCTKVGCAGSSVGTIYVSRFCGIRGGGQAYQCAMGGRHPVRTMCIQRSGGAKPSIPRGRDQ